ncbi:thioredoxin [Paucilactobacillus nenjiangensis]|jgi:thioredoxin 1|uniref:Thioredoxin n=1 Tax=Paucilactobacillus nenjiangensis TaxID=1296540 RepID=A0A5P1WYW0_9LACO|nr:thioredoxin [Paucilactobacillus nenjiangensis]QER66850.1 thioredoxin [Paucilactobacillus nenjiangensis]
MATIATKENFSEVTAGPITIVDFWAPWCGPCKMVDPILEQLEPQFADKINFVKMNVDDNQELAEQFKVMSIPSLVVFKNGVAKEKITGVFPKEKLERYFEKKIEE